MGKGGSRRWWHWLGLAVMVGFGAGCLVRLAPGAWADTAPSTVTASFLPGAIDLASGRTRDVVLLISDAGTVSVSGLRVTFTTDPGITVVASPAPTDLVSGSSAPLELHVTRSAVAAVTASVEAVLAYNTGSPGATRAEASIAALPITTPAAAATGAGPVTISPAVGTAQLTEYQSTDVYFTLTNRSDRPQHLDSVELLFPTALTVDLFAPHAATVRGINGTLPIGGRSGPGVLAPGDAMVVHFGITADKPVQPGDALVLLTARATDQVDRTTTTTVASQKITLSVLGESGVLQVLGVPSLLFVPGIVLAVVLWALWTYVYPRRAFTLSPSAGVEGKVVMWVFALLPSLALPFFYPRITGWFGPSHDYRKAYGLDDILYVWIIAAVAAFAFWALGVLARWGSLCFFIPQPHDGERVLVAKFGRRMWNRSLRRRSAVYDGAERVILLASHGVQTLVTPAVTYSAPTLTPEDLERLSDYAKGKPLRLGWFLWRRRAKVQLAYAPQTPLAGPTLIDPSKLTRFSEDFLVIASSE